MKLIDWPHFCFIKIVEIVISLIIGLAISGAILTKRKIIIDFFELFL